MDRAIAALAARQHDLVTVEQLAALGLTPSAVRKRAAAGRLHRRHQGVYSLSPSRPSPHARRLGAVLACGPGAVLSHRDAAALHGVRPTSQRRVHVTSPGRTGQTRPGIHAHTSRTLTAADITVAQEIRCTAVPRTLLDLAQAVDRDGLNRALERAERLRILDLRAIEDVLARNPAHRGARRLAAALGSPVDDKVLEQMFADRCLPPDAPAPERNVTIAGHECDFAWREERLNVETDGGTYHDTVAGGRRDRPRDRKLALAGWLVVRFDYFEVRDEPDRIAAEIRRLLTRPRSPAPLPS